HDPPEVTPAEPPDGAGGAAGGCRFWSPWPGDWSCGVEEDAGVVVVRGLAFDARPGCALAASPVTAPARAIAAAAAQPVRRLTRARAASRAERAASRRSCSICGQESPVNVGGR